MNDYSVSARLAAMRVRELHGFPAKPHDDSLLLDEARIISGKVKDVQMRPLLNKLASLRHADDFVKIAHYRPVYRGVPQALTVLDLDVTKLLEELRNAELEAAAEEGRQG